MISCLNVVENINDFLLQDRWETIRQIGEDTSLSHYVTCNIITAELGIQEIVWKLFTTKLISYRRISCKIFYYKLKLDPSQ